MTRYVIVGSGEAGTRATLALKARAGADDRITLIGAEDGLPYERPPLSKPTVDGTPRKLIAGNAAFEGIETLFGVEAGHIDRNAKALHLVDGRTLAYDRLLLATGARPRPLPCPGGGHALTLRAWQDAEAIHAKAAAGTRAVIVGAGLIGLELAAVLRQRGLSVTVLEAASRAMQRALPDAIAGELVARHRAEGVEIRFSAQIAEITEESAILGDGARLPADLIVAAIGVLPNTSLAEEAGIDCDNGILVNALLRTSDPDIFAAGDCAALDHPTFGRIRFESWRNACDMGAAAAAAMAGDPVTHTPGVWFWSDHYDLGLQMTGRFSPDDTVARREIGNGFLLFALDPSGRLRAAAGIGTGNAVAKDIRLAEMLIGQGVCPAPQSLQDPSLSLKTLLRPA